MLFSLINIPKPKDNNQFTIIQDTETHQQQNVADNFLHSNNTVTSINLRFVQRRAYLLPIKSSFRMRLILLCNSLEVSQQCRLNSSRISR